MENKSKKPFYKTVWFWVIIAVLVLGLAASGGSNDSKSATSANNQKKNKVTVVDLTSMTQAERDTWCDENKVKCKTKEEYSNKVAKGDVVSQSIAADKVIYEGDTILITVSLGKKPTVGEKNAVKKAESYLNYSAFSRSGLIKQLKFEGFTESEAVYGVDHVKVDWFEQAVKKGKSYLDYSAFSKQGLIAQLEYEGFTHKQAVYGAEKNGLK